MEQHVQSGRTINLRSLGNLLGNGQLCSEIGGSPEGYAGSVADVGQYQGVPEAVGGLLAAERYDTGGGAQPSDTSDSIPVRPCFHGEVAFISAEHCKCSWHGA